MDWIIFGLGNPGPEYSVTRHNAGFWVLDRMAEIAGLRFRKPFFSPWEQATLELEAGTLYLVKPLTYMNLSGSIVEAFKSKNSLESLGILVVADQLDLPPGQLRLKKNGSPGGHNGLKSLDQALQGGDYPRLYFGIGRPGDGNIVPWVLGAPEEQDIPLLQEGISRAATLLPKLVQGNLDELQQEINTRS